MPTMMKNFYSKLFLNEYIFKNDFFQTTVADHYQYTKYLYAFHGSYSI